MRQRFVVVLWQCLVVVREFLFVWELLFVRQQLVVLRQFLLTQASGCCGRCRHQAGLLPAMLTSEQQLAVKGTYAARMTPESDSAVGVLVFRAAPDGSTGYAAAFDSGRARVRLYDLASGGTLATAPLKNTPAGRSRNLEVAVDGPELSVFVDGKRLLHAEDHRHDTGSVGLLAQGGTVTFGPPSVSTITTNLTGWTTSGRTWTASPLGWHADPSQGATARAITATPVYDTALQVDLLLHDAAAIATLLVRTDAKAARGYGVQVDPGQGRLRLYRIDGDVTLGTYPTTIKADTVYRLRVEAEHDELRVHWQTNFLSPDGYSPVITAQDATHTTGRLAVTATSGAVSFENIAAADLVTGIQGWTARSGAWTPDLRATNGSAAQYFTGDWNGTSFTPDEADDPALAGGGGPHEPRTCRRRPGRGPRPAQSAGPRRARRSRAHCARVRGDGASAVRGRESG